MTADSTQAPGPQGANRDGMNTALRREGAAIGANTRINGELNADEDLLIEGSFTGTLLLRNHLLAIGAHGQVSGTAYANTITVDGQIDGDLYAAERISIRKGARVKGNILSPRVSLEDGAMLRGSVEMDPEAIQDAIQAKFGDLDKTSKPIQSKPMPVSSAPRPTPGAPVAKVGSPDAKPEPGKKPEPAVATK